MRVIIFVLILISNTTLNAKEIIGLPRIVDGDTIHIGEYKIRLEGIDAPEMKQTCKLQYLKLSFLSFNKTYYCGVKSKEKLSKKINNKKINCKISSRDRYKRYIATCYKNKTNLNKWMVRNGFAIAYRRYSNNYVPDEEFAKEKELGLWQGKFMSPERWRKLN